MNTQSSIIHTIIAIVALLSTPVFAEHGHGKSKSQQSEYYENAKTYDYAKVINVDPVIQHVRVKMPEQECWNEELRNPVVHRVHNDSAGSMIVGGIIGGLIGHHLGEGSGRHAATVAGTLIGASVGHDASTVYINTGEYSVISQRHCQTHNTYRYEERTVGYDVTYRYKGETYVTRMDQHPGKRIKIKVEVTPIIKMRHDR